MLALLRSALVFVFASVPIHVEAATGPNDDTTQAAFEFAFFVFEDFQVIPAIGVVYPPVFTEHFGPYTRKEPTAAQNRDPTVRTSAETLYYKGLELTVERNLDDTAFTTVWLTHVRITDASYALRGGFRVGDQLAKFVDALWPDAERFSEATKFYAGGYETLGDIALAAHASVTFEVSETGVVTAVDIDYWAD